MRNLRYCLFIGAVITAALPACAQAPRYMQTFNDLPTKALWAHHLDGVKPAAHPENILVTAGCGQDGSNCLRQVYRHADGIRRHPASNPVFATDRTGKVTWAQPGPRETNTATDVIQANIMIKNAAGVPVPSKSTTLSYKLFFEPGFDFARGGKLPGLAAKVFDSGCTEEGSAKRSGSNWSVRLMWRANGRVELYSYDQSRPAGSCGISTLVDHIEGESHDEVPGQVPTGRTKFRFKPGVWYTITLAVRVNDNNAIVYQRDANGQFVKEGLGDPIAVSANGAAYLKIDGADGTSTTLEIKNVVLRDECKGSCPAKVPDTPDTWVNGLFYSSFHGGNETRRVQCLNATAPSYPGLTQARYEQLCASHRKDRVSASRTWNPMTPTAARFDDFKVIEGYPH